MRAGAAHNVIQFSLYFLLRPKTLVRLSPAPSYTHIFTYIHIPEWIQLQLPLWCIFQWGSGDCWSHQTLTQTNREQRLVKECTKNRFERNRSTMNQECFPVFIYFIMYVYMYAWRYEINWHSSMHKCHIKKNMLHIWDDQPFLYMKRGGVFQIKYVYCRSYYFYYCPKSGWWYTIFFTFKRITLLPLREIKLLIILTKCNEPQFI